jgi:2-phospho-L-lactate guanylyltransferase
MHPGWTVLIPVKPWGEAKSRLAADHPAPALLARAFLEDVLVAATCVPRVRRIVVVSHDAEVAEVAHAHGAVTVDDTGHPGINAAIARGAESRCPGTALAALVSDLPWLTPRSLDSALALGEGHPTSFLADLEGTGTTLWMSASAAGLPTQFGPQSRAAHAASGAIDLAQAYPQADADLLPARCDADTADALSGHHGLVLGARTRRALQDAPLRPSS